MSLNCQMPKHADVWHVRDRVVPCTLMRQTVLVSNQGQLCPFSQGEKP